MSEPTASRASLSDNSLEEECGPRSAPFNWGDGRFLARLTLR